MCKRTAILKRGKIYLIACVALVLFYLPGCNSKTETKNTRKPNDYIKQIPGTNDSIPVEVVKKGKVLVSYSDCYTCHKVDQASVGPAFKDIAKRYPVNKVYIDMLARKVIVGGSRNWGYPVMSPHPELSFQNAKLMVTYILSMKN